MFFYSDGYWSWRCFLAFDPIFWVQIICTVHLVGGWSSGFLDYFFTAHQLLSNDRWLEVYVISNWPVNIVSLMNVMVKVNTVPTQNDVGWYGRMIQIIRPSCRFGPLWISLAPRPVIGSIFYFKLTCKYSFLDEWYGQSEHGTSPNDMGMVRANDMDN